MAIIRLVPLPKWLPSGINISCCDFDMVGGTGGLEIQGTVHTAINMVTVSKVLNVAVQSGEVYCTVVQCSTVCNSARYS